MTQILNAFGILLLLIGFNYVAIIIGYLHTQGAFKEYKKTAIAAYVIYVLYFIGMWYFGKKLWILVTEIFNNFTL